MLFSLIVGLAIGSIYGLTGVGLLLTYRTSGMFNLAHGAMGMLVAYIFRDMWEGWNWPLPLALAVALLVVAPAVGCIGYFGLFRWVRARPMAVTLVATIAAMTAIQGLASAIWGAGSYSLLPSIFPFRLVHLPGGVGVTTEQLGTLAVSASVAGVLAWYLRATPLGLKTRCVVDNRQLVEAVGEDPQRIEMTSWMIGSFIAGLSAILIVPFVQLSPQALTLVVIQAMAVTVVGGLRSLMATYFAGLGLGVLEAFLARYLPADRTLQGLKVSAAFLALYFAVLAGSRIRGFFPVASDGAGLVDRRGRGGGEASRAVLLVVAGLVGWGVLGGPKYLGFLLGAGMILSIGFQAFVVVTGLGGQVLLSVAALMGIGAVMYSKMVGEWGWPAWVALIAAPLVSVLLALAISIPGTRVRGLPFALLTLAFGLFMDSFVFATRFFAGNGGQQVARPEFLGWNLASDQSFEVFALVCAVVVALLVGNLGRGRTGRVLTALRNSESAAEALGASVRSARLVLFSLAALLAGFAGCLTAIQLQSISAVQFNVGQSIFYLVAVVIGGVATPLGALLGGLLVVLGPEGLSRVGLSEYSQLAFGLAAAASVLATSDGLGGLIGRLRGASRGWGATLSGRHSAGGQSVLAGEHE